LNKNVHAELYTYCCGLADPLPSSKFRAETVILINKISMPESLVGREQSLI